MVAALLKEIEIFDWTQTAATEEEIETVYFGGGTPSLLDGEELKEILAAIHHKFRVSPDTEVTLETNPDDISAAALAEWKGIGINRLSIGVQSFYEEDLLWMNRAHNAQQAIDALTAALTVFPNITIDLIYGTPGLTDEKWKSNVERAVALGIPHLSCYALTVEPKTPLQKMIALKQTADVNPDAQSSQFLLLMDWLTDAGYEHYEISNFAKPGFRSRHNSSYWEGKTYLGFGPSAHSFDGQNRWWNVANNNKYIESISNGVLPMEKELLTAVDRLNEYIMISLRTSAGTKFERLRSLQADPDKEMTALIPRLKEYERHGLMNLDAEGFRLTRRGRLLADGIAADLFT